MVDVRRAPWAWARSTTTWWSRRAPTAEVARGRARSDGVAEVGQGLPQQHPVAALHLGLHAGVERLVGGEPGEVERVVLRGAVAGHRARRTPATPRAGAGRGRA